MCSSPFVCVCVCVCVCVFSIYVHEPIVYSNGFWSMDTSLQDLRTRDESYTLIWYTRAYSQKRGRTILNSMYLSTSLTTTSLDRSTSFLMASVVSCVCTPIAATAAAAAACIDAISAADIIAAAAVASAVTCTAAAVASAATCVCVEC